MAKEDNSLFSTENLIKGFIMSVGLAIQGFVVFFNLKAEIHDNKTNYDADKRIIEYRLRDLENCCNGKLAVRPKELKLETE